MPGGEPLLAGRAAKTPFVAPASGAAGSSSVCAASANAGRGSIFVAGGSILVAGDSITAVGASITAVGASSTTDATSVTDHGPGSVRRSGVPNCPGGSINKHSACSNSAGGTIYYDNDSAHHPHPTKPPRPVVAPDTATRSSPRRLHFRRRRPQLDPQSLHLRARRLHLRARRLLQHRQSLLRYPRRRLLLPRRSHFVPRGSCAEDGGASNHHVAPVAEDAGTFTNDGASFD